MQPFVIVAILSCVTIIASHLTSPAYAQEIWTRNCNQNGECLVSKRVTAQNIGFVNLTINYARRIMGLVLPPDQAIQIATLQIRKGNSIVQQIAPTDSSCHGLCFVHFHIDEEFLNSMKKGNEVIVMGTKNGSAINFSIPLNGFEVAYSGGLAPQTAQMESNPGVSGSVRDAMIERERKCAAEWRAAKASGAMTAAWPSYWNDCNQRLKTIEGQSVPRPANLAVAPYGTSQGLVPRGDETPSFDCSQAKSAAPRLICADGDLAKLDQKLASAYRDWKTKIPTQEQTKLIAEQVEWIKARNNDCGLVGKDTAAIDEISFAKSCMAKEMQARTMRLTYQLEDSITLWAHVKAASKRVTDQANTVTNVERRKELDTITVRLSKVTDKISLTELKAVDADAKAANQILDEAAEFKTSSEIANQRLASVEAALAKLTFDAPLIQDIKATMAQVKNAQKDSNLQSLKAAFTKLVLLSDPNKLNRLVEAKGLGFDTIEAYDQYEEEKQKLSRSGIRLKSR
jgi:uncharacterized protein YecT (DUF1311 family)/invasion protein IalB